MHLSFNMFFKWDSKFSLKYAEKVKWVIYFIFNISYFMLVEDDKWSTVK